MTDRLTALDASFLYLERPNLHMHVAGLSMLDPRTDGPLLFDDVRRVMAARIHLAPRLRRRIVPVPGGLGSPVWADDPRFDLDYHLRRAALPEPGGREELSDGVGRVLSRQLDRSRPLWELYVFEGVEKGRTAILMKMHHAMADGIAAMQIGSVLFDLTPDAVAGEPEDWAPEPSPAPRRLLEEAAREQIRDPIDALRSAVRAPRRAVEAVVDTVSGVGAVAGMGRRPRGPFDAKIGPSRRFGMAEVPFDRLREIRSALGGTINDAVLTGVAGGIHDLLRTRGEPVRGRSLRIMVPVSVRGRDDGVDVANRVAPAIVDVPVGAMTPRGRLIRVRRATAELKGSGMAESVDSIIGLGAYAPAALHAAAARVASRGPWFNLVVSNIPAPQVPLYLAGAPLLANYPSVPLGENAALSIACSSVGGTMAFGLTADWDAVPDLDVLARGIEGGLASLWLDARR